MPTAAGFAWGTASVLDDLENSGAEAYFGGTLSGTSGSFTATLSSLEPGTTYYYKAFVIIGNQKYFYGERMSFTTSASDAPGTSRGWLELPAATSGSDYYSGEFKSGTARNYSYLYQYSTYTSLWTAYPLYSGTMGGGYSASWDKNPDIAQSRQVNCWDASYNVIYGETNYVDNAASASEYYSRGHNIPNADRNGDNTMQAQTFYATNSTPQIQNKFNASIWSKLEGDVRTIASATDTVYVVTGAAFHKGANGTESVTMITPKGDPTKSVPVPNYYWKVLLKVKWSGSGSSRTVISASAVGVWLPHQQYSGSDYSSYVVSVNDIESWTGFDLFANLPDDKEESAESNTSWTSFQNF